MGEPIPGQCNDEIIEPEEILKDRFDGLAIVEGVRLRVFWNSDINAYILEVKELNGSGEVLASPFTDDNQTAEKIFSIAKDNVIPEYSDQSLNMIYNLIQDEINKK